MLPLFFLACFICNCVLFMENPEVKCKQFLSIPGGSRVEAKSCSCQRPSVFLSLHASSFLPSHCILARNKTNTNLVGGLSWNNWRWPMGSFTPFWIALPFVEPRVRGDTCRWADHVLDCATAGCCHHISALTVELLATVCTYALSISPSNFWSSVIICQRF